MRREFSAKVKIAAFKRCSGRCEECKGLLYTGKFRYDHQIPDQLGGEPTLENCVVRCSNCDTLKTYGSDIPNIAKAKRRESKHIGANRPKGRPIMGSKRSGWKKKISGEVVRRSDHSHE